MQLYQHQLEALEELHNGSILCGDVGTGKSRTALAYYYIKVCGGEIDMNGEGSWGESLASPRDLYIITTAKKRDSYEWMKECSSFGLFEDAQNNQSGVKVIVDSWQNIKKYVNIQNAFFIFDEQKVGGCGAWAKAFLRITRRNKWIILSATPGDTWKEYLFIFMANGFYRSKSEFYDKHCVFAQYCNYPKIKGYIDTGTLNKHLRDILVKMEFRKSTIQNHIDILCEYDKTKYRLVQRDHWDPYDNEPIEEVGKYCYLLRKVVNSDYSRLIELSKCLNLHKRVIVFYNHTHEVEAIKEFFADQNGLEIAEWNGQHHNPIPRSERWLYLVQYSSGAEGWNCVDTNCVVFYSQSYSYKQTVQAAGRIDRLNTTYIDLFYYHFKSSAPIDKAISRALSQKKDFNEHAIHFA